MVIKLIGSFFIGILLCTAVWYFLGRSQKIAYIDNQKVFNGYKMSSVYLRELELEKKALIVGIDSLQREYNVISHLAESDYKKTEMYRISMALEGEKERADHRLNELTRKYDEQVWNSINEKLMKFGNEKEYDLILGANGTGTLLYARNYADITQEVIDYLNH